MINGNAMEMLKFVGLWKEFTKNHPKFPKFLKAVTSPGVIGEEAIVEVKVTTREGKIMETNLKVLPEDLALFEQLRNMK